MLPEDLGNLERPARRHQGQQGTKPNVVLRRACEKHVNRFRSSSSKRNIGVAVRRESRSGPPAHEGGDQEEYISNRQHSSIWGVECQGNYRVIGGTGKIRMVPKYY